MGTTTEAELDRPAASSGSSAQVQGPKLLGYSPLLPQGLYLGAGLEVQQQGLKPTPIWLVSAAGSGFTC